MAFNKRTWKGRQGTGLNKFSINGATPVPVVNQPDSVTEQGDALSAGNLNDLEDRIYTAFEDEATAREDADTDLRSAIAKNTAEIENLKQTSAQTEITVSYPDDGNYSALMPNLVPQKSAKYAEIKSIVGKSRAWNNVASLTLSDWIAESVNLSISDGKFTLTPTTDSSVGKQIKIALLNGRTYLVSAKASTSNASNQARITFRNSDTSAYHPSINTTSTTGEVLTDICSITDSGSFLCLSASPSTLSSEHVYFEDVIIRDLTIIFPEGVPSTVAECVAKCPSILEYDAYGYSLVDTVVEGVKSVGVNIWDEQYKLGNYSDSTGEYVDAGNYVISKNPIPILPNHTYYCNKLLRKFYYTADMTYIGNTGNLDSSFTTPANAYYMNIRVHQETGAYNNDVQICDNALSSEVKNTYHPYMTDTLTLPSPVTGKSAGSVHQIYYPETGEMTNPLKTKTFTVDDVWYSATIGGVLVYYHVLEDNKPNTANAIMADYVRNADNYGMPDKTFSLNGGGGTSVWIRDTEAASPVASYFAGKTLVYELATPNPDTDVGIVIDNTLEVEPNGTVETVQTQATKIDNCLDVNYDLIPV